MRVESVHSCTDSGSRTWLHPRDAVNSGQTCRGLEETGPRMSLTAYLTVAHLRSISSHLTLHPFHIYASMPAKVSLSSSIARRRLLVSSPISERRECPATLPRWKKKKKRNTIEINNLIHSRLVSSTVSSLDRGAAVDNMIISWIFFRREEGSVNLKNEFERWINC